jgi:hypothetical protein
MASFNFGMQIADFGFCVSDMFDVSIYNPQLALLSNLNLMEAFFTGTQKNRLAIF